MMQARQPRGQLGLGCSRLGSVLTGGDLAGAERLVRGAIDLGIRHFDTANIYGQGDSERVLGRVLRDAPADIVIASKIGQRQPMLKRMLVPLKRPLIALVSRSGGLRRELAADRAKPLPTEFRPPNIRRAVEKSLRRLDRDRIDIFYLHGPSAEEIASGEAVGALDDLRVAGKLGTVGVSCDTVEEVRLALKDDRVGVVQLPFGIRHAEMAPEIALASRKGVKVVVREILSGVRGEGAHQGDIAEAVRFAVDHAGVDVALLGSTNPSHVASVIATVSAKDRRST